MFDHPVSKNFTARQLAVKAILSNPVAQLTADHLQILDSETGDISFDEIGIDSMGLMELSIWLEIETGLSMTAGEIARLQGLCALQKRIASHLDQRVDTG